MKKIIKQPPSISSVPQSQDISPSSPQTNRWDAPIIPATKVSPELISILYRVKPEFQIPSSTSVGEAAELYFKQYMRLLDQNNRLNDDLSQIFEERNFLIQKYNHLKREETNFEENVQRKRRYAHQIHRDFPCPMENCNKSYGTQGSLTQHVKLKHEEFYKTGQYEIELQKMLDKMSRQVKKQEKEE